MNIKVGESLNLVAKVDGFPVPECLWYFGDNLMQQTDLAKFEVKLEYLVVPDKNQPCTPFLVELQKF